MKLAHQTAEFKVLHLFCGLGGGALGFQRATAERLGVRGRFRTIAGIDVDADACRDFRKLTGASATCADVASMTCEQLRRACRGEAPDVIFTSPPCKGFSGLLPSDRAKAEKYKKLNRLVFQGLFLALETFPGAQLPGLIVLENVPRIQQRGRDLLFQVKSLLSRYGYVFHESTHDCGELGGLAQHRTRYLLVARLPAKVPTFVYRPPKERVRAIGEVLKALPMPDDPRGGPLHALPRLEWRTWVRLALIPAGGDWRDLPGSSTTEKPNRKNGLMRVAGWRDAANTVTGATRPNGGGGALSCADPRVEQAFNRVYGVVPWTYPSGTVTGNGRPSAGAFSVADPRGPKAKFNNTFRVISWTETAGAVTAGGSPSAAGACVADPRLIEDPNRHHAKFRVEAWYEAAHTVTSSDRVGSGAPSVGDPRIGNWADRPGLMGVMGWDQSSRAVTGKATVSGGNAAAAVADPRPTRVGNYGVMSFDEPAGTVTGSADVAQGKASVADPRIPADDDRPDPVPLIVALDGTWHRPLTTLELAALQDLPVFDSRGRPLRLAGKSQARWRERIGNCVPVGAAKAIGGALLLSLIGDGARASEGFFLAPSNVWVRRASRLAEEQPS